MPKEFNRSERVAGQLRRELAQLIQFDMKNPQVGFVSVSDVVVSRDLSHAKVYISVFQEEQAVRSLKALNGAAGYMRKRLGQELHMRLIPELKFIRDTSLETGEKMDNLINRALAADRTADNEEE